MSQKKNRILHLPYKAEVFSCKDDGDRWLYVNKFVNELDRGRKEKNSMNVNYNGGLKLKRLCTTAGSIGSDRRCHKLATDSIPEKLTSKGGKKVMKNRICASKVDSGIEKYSELYNFYWVSGSR